MINNKKKPYMFTYVHAKQTIKDGMLSLKVIQSISSVLFQVLKSHFC